MHSISTATAFVIRKDAATWANPSKTTEEEAPRALSPEEEKSWEAIRQAGQPRFTHKVCLFWQDSPYPLGKSQQSCCILRFIRIISIAAIAVNPKSG
jgi:hypothetical protein